MKETGEISMNFQENDKSQEGGSAFDLSATSYDESQFQESDNDELLVDDRKDHSRRNFLIAGGTVGLGIAGLATYAILANPFGIGEISGGGEPSDGGGADQKVSNGGGAQDPLKAAEREAGSQWWEQDKNRFPVSVDTWAQDRYQDKGGLKSHRKEIIDSRGGTELSIQSIQMPSEEAGFTSDDNQQFDSSGNPNPFYSYWTAEEFQSYSHSYVERLMNPIYGGWARFQFPTYPANQTLDFSLFEDMFSDKYTSENQNKKYSEYLPIMADWNGDNYGGVNNLLSEGSRWYGTTSDVEVVPEFDNNIQQYIVHYNAKVTFTSWTQDQSKLEKNGVLELTFIANAGENSSPNKVLIDQAKLTMDGE